jgi:hypothetical protein
LPYCPRCRSEYRAGFTRCADCGLDLVDELPEEIREEVPEEEVAEEAKPRREWLSQFIPSTIDTGVISRCIKVLCWILLAVALYKLLFHTAISLEHYFAAKIWQQEAFTTYVGFIFLTLFSFEDLLLFILALFLSASLVASQRTLMFELMFYFALLMAIWHTAGLVFFVITVVQNDFWDNSQAVTFAAGVFVFLMIILMGAAATLLSRRLRMTTSTVGV